MNIQTNNIPQILAILPAKIESSPKPGPTFDIAVAEPDNAVIKSNPFKESIAAEIKKIKKQRKINVIMEYTKVLLIFSLLYFIGNNPFG